jgi:hypothetical protein
MTATPPLLMLAEGRRPRARRTPVARPREIVLHMGIAKLLRDHALPSWQWCHIPTGELRDKRTAGKLRQMGVKAGWPDFVLIPPDGQLHCLELKRQGERLSDSQEAFQLWCIRSRVPYSVCRTIDESLAVLDAWSCLRIKFGGSR